MKRHTLFAFFTLALAAAPFHAAAQQPGKLPVIGILMPTVPPPPSTPQVEQLLQGLRELGYEHGKTATIEIRYGANNPDRVAEFAADLIRLRAAVIATSGDLSTSAEGLRVTVSPMLVSSREAIVALSARRRMPTIYGNRESAEVGGLISYGPNLADTERIAAAQIDWILKGAKSADLPVQQATKFDLVINLKTAKALGLSLPESLRQRADQVVQ
jgi:ABC transporter substrate binding protein